MIKNVYADNAATTKLSPTVFEAMKRILPKFTEIRQVFTNLVLNQKKQLIRQEKPLLSVLMHSLTKFSSFRAEVRLTTGLLKVLPNSVQKRVKSILFHQSLNIMLFSILLNIYKNMALK